MSSDRPEKLMLLDTASMYFRAFFGVPESITAANGQPVNAIRGLADMIARLITDFEPTHVIACWDDDWRPAWRVAAIPTYKAHRVVEPHPGGADIEETPSKLDAQVPVIRELLNLVGIPIIGVAEAEADDVIGTLATKADLPVDIVTGDRDLYQLVDDTSRVRVISTTRGMRNLELMTEAVVLSKYGVLPQQYADYATMRGDPSDGLPGVPGVGEKTAAGLMQTFGTLDQVRNAAANGLAGMSASVRAKILGASEYLDVAPEVVRVRRDLPIEFDHDSCRLRDFDNARKTEIASFSSTWNCQTNVDHLVTAIVSVWS